jgi:hypothetical protein
VVKVSLVTSDEPDQVWSYPKYDVLRDEQRICASALRPHALA